MVHIRQVIDDDQDPKKSVESRRLHYPQARDWYLKGIEKFPKDAKLDANMKLSFNIGLYNLACTYAVMARDEKDESVRIGLINEAFKWLKQSVEWGFGEHKCRCHDNGFKHMEHDKDFSAINKDERFKRLLKPEY